MCGWQGKLSHYFGQPLSHAQLAEAFVEIDADNSGTIDFAELVASLGSFASLSEDGIYKFLFDIYDKVRGNVLHDALCTLMRFS